MTHGVEVGPICTIALEEVTYTYVQVVRDLDLLHILQLLVVQVLRDPVIIL